MSFDHDTNLTHRLATGLLPGLVFVSALTTHVFGLQVSFTVEDLGAFNEPWSAVVRYQHARTPVTLVEEPCAENNVGHPGNFFQVPVATKTDF